MDGRDCTRSLVVGWVDAWHRVPVRDVSRGTETGALLAVEVCCLTATPLQCSLHYINMIEVVNYVHLKYIQAYVVHLSPYYSVYLYSKEQNIWGHFISLSPSLALFAIILGIKCHCFDTIAQTQKCFLKGDRAISLPLDI